MVASSAHRSEFGASSLGSDQLIVAFLKGANRLCPPRAVLSPIWDLSMVLSSQCQPPLEPILESDIKGCHSRQHFSWQLQQQSV